MAITVGVYEKGGFTPQNGHFHGGNGDWSIDQSILGFVLFSDKARS